MPGFLKNLIAKEIWVFEMKTGPGYKLASRVNEHTVNFSSFLMYMVRLIPLHSYKEKKKSEWGLPLIHSLFFFLGLVFWNYRVCEKLFKVTDLIAS